MFTNTCQSKWKYSTVGTGDGILYIINKVTATNYLGGVFLLVLIMSVSKKKLTILSRTEHSTKGITLNKLHKYNTSNIHKFKYPNGIKININKKSNKDQDSRCDISRNKIKAKLSV